MSTRRVIDEQQEVRDVIDEMVMRVPDGNFESLFMNNDSSSREILCLLFDALLSRLGSLSRRDMASLLLQNPRIENGDMVVDFRGIKGALSSRFLPHENVVVHTLKSTNILRMLCVNYRYVYFGIQATPPFTDDNNNVVTWGVAPSTSFTYLFCEKKGKRMEEFLRTCSSRDFWCVYLQLCYALISAENAGQHPMVDFDSLSVTNAQLSCIYDTETGTELLSGRNTLIITPHIKGETTRDLVICLTEITRKFIGISRDKSLDESISSLKSSIEQCMGNTSARNIAGYVRKTFHCDDMFKKTIRPSPVPLVDRLMQVKLLSDRIPPPDNVAIMLRSLDNHDPSWFDEAFHSYDNDINALLLDIVNTITSSMDKLKKSSIKDGCSKEYRSLFSSILTRTVYISDRRSHLALLLEIGEHLANATDRCVTKCNINKTKKILQQQVDPKAHLVKKSLDSMIEWLDKNISYLSEKCPENGKYYSEEITMLKSSVGQNSIDIYRYDNVKNSHEDTDHDDVENLYKNDPVIYRSPENEHKFSMEKQSIKNLEDPVIYRSPENLYKNDPVIYKSPENLYKNDPVIYRSPENLYKNDPVIYKSPENASSLVSNSLCNNFN